MAWLLIWIEIPIRGDLLLCKSSSVQLPRRRCTMYEVLVFLRMLSARLHVIFEALWNPKILIIYFPGVLIDVGLFSVDHDFGVIQFPPAVHSFILIILQDLVVVCTWRYFNIKRFYVTFSLPYVKGVCGSGEDRFLIPQRELLPV